MRKIRKKIKKGPKAPYAALLALTLTVLHGPERKGGDFRHSIDNPGGIRAALEQWLGPQLIPADRPLSPEEFEGWAETTSPGRLGGMFARSGHLPMGPPTGEADDTPFLGILPVLAIRKSRELNDLFKRIGAEFPEVSRVAFHNVLNPSLNLIPGYDYLLHSPLVHVKDLNRAVSHLNSLCEDAFQQASKPYPGPFTGLHPSLISSFPVSEPLIS